MNIGGHAISKSHALSMGIIPSNSITSTVLRLLFYYLPLLTSTNSETTLIHDGFEDTKWAFPLASTAIQLCHLDPFGSQL